MEPVASFRVPFRVRFDEAGPDGCVPPSGLVRYLQDAAWQHSEAVGFGRDWYAARGIGWLARGLDLVLTGCAPYGETIEVETELIGWRRVGARRRSRIRDARGAPVAESLVDWALVDEAGRPVRVPDEIVALAPMAGPFQATRIDLPAERPADLRVPLPLRRRDADPMGHLNNAAYLDLLDETLTRLDPPPPALTRIRLEHLRPALPGMRPAGAAWRLEDGGLAWRLEDEESGSELARAIAG